MEKPRRIDNRLIIGVFHLPNIEVSFGQRWADDDPRWQAAGLGDVATLAQACELFDEQVYDLPIARPLPTRQPDLPLASGPF